MFAIVISEKGGAERRESFDKNEINVGRVQGNDLMLPKGNVSKHHARLLFRDGRFIVTDLKSTNGTYVNGRKIAQATIVREGDKIYVGDFVLRVEVTSSPGSSPNRTSTSIPAAASITAPSAGVLGISSGTSRPAMNLESEFTTRHDGASLAQSREPSAHGVEGPQDGVEAHPSLPRIPTLPGDNAPPSPTTPGRQTHNPPMATLIPRSASAA